jgi:predicted MFS family arabinose efflux permease
MDGPPAQIREPHRAVVIAALGLAQIFAWGTSFYFPAVFAGPIVNETGWSLGWVVSGTSIGLPVAGLVSPLVGRTIESHGGRPVLFASSLLYAVGLGGIGLAPNLEVYLAAWVLLGLGMGTGLYDAVFAALGRMYGDGARGPITNLTLFGGFASTVCWPLSALLIEQSGWRIACFIYAAIHLLVALPLQMAVVKSSPQTGAGGRDDGKTVTDTPPLKNEPLVLILLGLIQSIGAAVGSIVVVHLLIFMQARGLTYAAAVALGTLFGPAQVGARIVERVFGSHYHPIWTLIASCTLMALGLIMLYADFPWLALVILIYGAGYGISWIARGTLPLALSGPIRFPRLIGKLAFPSLIAQALAPSVGAWLVDRSGANATIGVLTLLGLANVLLVVLLWITCRAHITRTS